MIKLDVEEFIEEIKAEMYGYEEIDEELIELWEKKFRDYIKEKKAKKNRINYKTNSILIKDESELFDIVDNYLAAIVNDEMDQYWANYSI